MESDSSATPPASSPVGGGGGGGSPTALSVSRRLSPLASGASASAASSSVSRSPAAAVVEEEEAKLRRTLRTQSMTNVQEPVRDILDSLIRLVTAQSSRIASLEAQVAASAASAAAAAGGAGATATATARAVDDVQSQVSEERRKRAAMEITVDMLREQVAGKLGREELAPRLAELEGAMTPLDRLQHDMTHQVSHSAQLAERVDALQGKLEHLTARRDEVVAQVEADMRALSNRVEDRMQHKLDSTTFEALMSSRPRNDDLQSAVHDKVTRMQLEHALAAKADSHDVHSLQHRMADCIGREEMNQTLAAQLRPLVSAVSALEKAQQLQQQSMLTATQLNASAASGAGSARNASAALDGSGTADDGDDNNSLFRYRVQRIVQETVQECEAEAGGRVSHVQLQKAVATMRETVLRQVEAELAAVRAETSENVGGGVTSVRTEAHEGLIDLRERQDALQASLERTQTELVRAINKKAYKSELARALQNKVDRPEFDDVVEHKIDRSQLDSALQRKVDTIDCHNSVEDLRQELNAAMTEMSQMRAFVRADMERLSASVSEKASQDAARAARAATSTGDWRVSLGEVALNLRHELADKADKEEVLSTVNRESERTAQKLSELESRVEDMAEGSLVSQLDADLASLSRRVAGELTGGRWLWRSGRTHRGGWVPWEVQVINAAPDNMLWKKDATSLSLIIPGLYQVVAAFFTSVPSVVQICLNGEPVLTLEPLQESSNVAALLFRAEDQYVMRRSRHSAGDVTCVHVAEYLALPEHSAISVRYVSPVRAQGFLSLRKL